MTHEQIVPTTPWWRRWLPGVLAAIAGTAVVIAAGWYYVDSRRSCGDGVTKYPGSEECVGITTGAYHFTFDRSPEQEAELRKVLELIDKANQATREGDVPWISVAYLLPMPWGQQGTLPPDSVVHQLYGAYAAQIQANEGGNGAGTPKVRLLVANTGHDGVAWERVATELVQRRSTDRIAAVVGLGQSRDTTEFLAKHLSQKSMPMVGATITADNLNGNTYPHLHRVSPTNADEVAVGLSYLRDLRKPAAAKTGDTYLLAAGNANDTYVAALKAAFGKAFSSDFSTRTFNSEEIGHDQVLNNAAADVCSAESPVTVYFAGRSPSLRIFLRGLGDQCAKGHQVTVLSGDDANGLVGHVDAEFTAALTEKSIRIYYTGLTHPDQWVTVPTELNNLRKILVEKTNNTGPDLSDGAAMMGFDAVMVAVRAVRSVAPKKESLDKLDSLSNGFEQINVNSPYCGASGPIALGTDQPAAVGNTVNKPIPVIELKPDGSAAFRALRYPEQPQATSADFWKQKCGGQQGAG